MPAVVGDIFGLGDVYIRQVSPVTVGIDTSGNFITESGWSNLRSYGWFGGGLTPSVTVSSVDRIDFSNDTSTSTPRGALSVARRSLSAVGNSNYGWFGGGWFTPSSPQINYSTIDRIDFSNDSATALARGPLTSTRYSMGATENSNYGWFGGGQLFDPVTPANTRKTSVDRIDFSNDSATASPRGPLSLARSNLAATGNSNYGWFGGGYAPTSSRSTVDRIDFSNDSATALPRGVLNVGRTSLAATGNSNYGWFGGGYDPALRSTVDRIDFANDLSTASPRGPLSSPSRNRIAATGNSNYGWFGGQVSTVDRIDFSNDLAIASIRGSLSSPRENPGATSGQAKGPAIRLQKAGNFGWFGAGYFAPAPPGSGGQRSTVDRINFSNDSVTSTPRGPLSSARYWFSATGNSNYGWFAAGIAYPAINFTTVDRINFSNDLVTASVRASLNSTRNRTAATGNSNYGWFGGGYVGNVGSSQLSSVERVDFSNDSATARFRGSLTSSRYGPGATANSNYGWFGGGPGLFGSVVDRIDFSNDSPTTSPRGPLVIGRRGLAATGNSNYGWFGGGGTPGISAVQRIDFSNDSAIASPRSPLSSIRYGMGATGNSNYGWFGGGNFGTISRIERIDFSNDSVGASIRGSLSSQRDLLGSPVVSNTPIG